MNRTHWAENKYKWNIKLIIFQLSNTEQQIQTNFMTIVSKSSRANYSPANHKVLHAQLDDRICLVPFPPPINVITFIHLRYADHLFFLKFNQLHYAIEWHFSLDMMVNGHGKKKK